MAEIVGGLGTSHIPGIGNAIAKGLQQDPYWKPFFDGFIEAHKWLARIKPDVVVMFYNDHGLNFFLDKLPTFAVCAADENVSNCVPMSSSWPSPPISVRSIARPRLCRLRLAMYPSRSSRCCPVRSAHSTIARVARTGR